MIEEAVEAAGLLSRFLEGAGEVRRTGGGDLLGGGDFRRGAAPLGGLCLRAGLRLAGVLLRGGEAALGAPWRSPEGPQRDEPPVGCPLCGEGEAALGGAI